MTSSIPIIPFSHASAFIERFARRAQPAVIRGAIDDWRSYRLWSNDYLGAKLAGRRFLVNRTPRGRFSIFSSRMIDADGTLIVTFDEFVALLMKIANGNSGRYVHYMQQKNMADHFPELIDDVEYVDFIDKGLIRDVNFWFGQRDSCIPLHFDTFDNLLVQLRGTKSVRLLAPSQSPFLYPGRDGAEFASKVDIDAPDLARYPLFSRAAVDYTFRLNPGEILYLPAFWWHYIVTESADALSLNYWYHLAYGSDRTSFMAARELWKLCVHYLGDLPPAQKRRAIEECRQSMDLMASACADPAEPGSS
ncbi:hypothetical protein WL40_00125 [Burkholderia ubonensis]|uniref:cupin-like domain-containing protein n=1 Tax=Burkholderia ubonensis TaxID=101571 RepID=UPI0007584059|nr:cupin-like domain-containing protein [Burkholderia ubonensis]KWB76686.1 hypothetical protein WL40_00125 [Burkholderia ubonensis]